MIGCGGSQFDDFMKIECPKGHILIAGGKSGKARSRFYCPYCKCHYKREKWKFIGGQGFSWRGFKNEKK